MSQICIEAEKTDVVELERDFLDRTFTRIDQSVAMAALFTAHHLRVKAIAALTQSGSTALWMSRHNCGCPIFALTPEVSTQRKMALFRNVRPLFLEQSADRDSVLRAAEDLLAGEGPGSARRPHRAHHRRADGQVRRHQRAQDCAYRGSSLASRPHRPETTEPGPKPARCARRRDRHARRSRPHLSAVALLHPLLRTSGSTLPSRPSQCGKAAVAQSQAV